MRILPLLILSFLSMGMLPRPHQVIGLVLVNEKSAYSVVQVPEKTLSLGDVVAFVRDESERGQASVVALQTDRAMVRWLSTDFTPAAGDQVAWLSHGPASSEPAPPFPRRSAAGPTHKPATTPAFSSMDNPIGPVTAKPVTAKPVTVKPVTVKPVTAKPVTAKPVTAKPVTAKPVTIKPVTSKPVTSKPVTIKPETPSKVGVPHLSPTTTRPATRKLPQDAGLLDSGGQKVTFQQADERQCRLLIGGAHWKFQRTDCDIFLKAIRAAQLNKNETVRIGSLILVVKPQQLVLRGAEGQVALFEGAQLTKLEQLLTSWK